MSGTNTHPASSDTRKPSGPSKSLRAIPRLLTAALQTNSTRQAIRLMRREGAASPPLTNIEDSSLKTGRLLPAPSGSSNWQAKRLTAVCLLGRIAFTCCLSTASITAAQENLGPQGAVRRFCELDGLGQRLATATWPAFAAVVEWPLEPVWDHVALITGYQVGPPLPYDLESMAVEVRYSVVAQLSANGEGDQAYVEKVRFRVRPDDSGSWRVMGPPPHPHVFASGVDIGSARRALQPGQPRYLTNSDFVWQMFRASGWELDYESTADLPSGNSFRRVVQPAPGDLVVYFNNGTPYHVGILENEHYLTSATVNAGIIRTPLEAFAGELAYLRLVQPPPTATKVQPTPEATPTPQPTATPKPSTPKPARTAVTKKMAKGKSKPAPPEGKAFQIKKAPPAKQSTRKQATRRKRETTAPTVTTARRKTSR